MFSPFLAVLGTWVALMEMCEAENFDGANVGPLSIVYTVYPYYNSDALLMRVFKAEEARVQLSSGINGLGRETDQQESRNSADSGATRATSGGSVYRELSRNNSNEASAGRNEANAEITYWPPNQSGADAPKLRLSRGFDRSSSRELKSDIYNNNNNM